MRLPFLAVLFCFWLQFLWLCFALRDRDSARRDNVVLRAEVVACGRSF